MFKKIYRFFGLPLELNEEDRIDLIFFLTLPLPTTAMWCIYVYFLCFRMGISDHTLGLYFTVLWLSIIGGFTARKLNARKSEKRLDGRTWGKQLGGLTFLYCFVLCLLYRWRPDMDLPPELYAGMTGILVYIFGWEILKLRRISIWKNDSGKNGKEPPPAPEPSELKTS